jgi:predicted nucleotidyltransferase component of viral defense system
MKLYSPKEAVELFHLILLDLLGRKVDKKRYVLKGGCNLRFFFKSFRYSEDMDLDVSRELSKDKLQDAVNRILDSKPLEQILEVRGMRIVDRSSPKQTDTTQRWKFELRIPGSNVKIRTKIEFSRRGMKTGLAFDSVDANLIRSYELAPILASHYHREEAYLQKVAVLASRRQIQARDAFDLYLLLTSGVDQAVVYDKAVKYFDKARENAWAISFDMFKSQVVSYLHPEYQAQYTSPELWDSMILKVIAALGGSDS